MRQTFANKRSKPPKHRVASNGHDGKRVDSHQRAGRRRSPKAITSTSENSTHPTLEHHQEMQTGVYHP
jgi:hypothetical protein